MSYENEEDRVLQSIYAEMVKGYLCTALGYRLRVKQTYNESAMSHDIEVYREGGDLVGVGEVKCRHDAYNESFFKRNGWLMDHPRIEYMTQLSARRKVLGFLGLLTSDCRGYIISMAKLNKIMPDIRQVGPGMGMMKDDHGRKSKDDKTGVIIPLKAMVKIGERP